MRSSIYIYAQALLCIHARKSCFDVDVIPNLDNAPKSQTNLILESHPYQQFHSQIKWPQFKLAERGFLAVQDNANIGLTFDHALSLIMHPHMGCVSNFNLIQTSWL